ncbi:MAG: hypothetical protein AB7S38_30205 [Vulcanimicrobiota bacterium]
MTPSPLLVEVPDPDLSLDRDEVLAALPPQPPLDEVRESTPEYTRA